MNISISEMQDSVKAAPTKSSFKRNEAELMVDNFVEITLADKNLGGDVSRI